MGSAYKTLFGKTEEQLGKPTHELEDNITIDFKETVLEIVGWGFFLNWYGGGWSPIGSTRHCGHKWPIVPTPGDYDDGETGGMIGRGNRSTRRESLPQ
jgi:hypothetical protein